MTRCKVKCTSITQVENWSRKTQYVYIAEFQACDPSKSNENAGFFEATPSVSIKLGAIKQDHFVVGKEYYLDFTLAE